MNLASAPAALALAGYTGLFNNAVLTIYSGTQPLHPEDALNSVATNTALVSFTFASPAFSTASFSGGFESQTGSFTAPSANPVASGTATFARIAVSSTTWATSHSYNRGDIVTAGSNLYVAKNAGTSASSGTGPSGTTLGIVDGGVVWDYLNASTGQGGVLGDFTVGTTGTDITIGNTAIQIGVSCTMSGFTMRTAAV